MDFLILIDALSKLAEHKHGGMQEQICHMPSRSMPIQSFTTQNSVTAYTQQMFFDKVAASQVVLDNTKLTHVLSFKELGDDWDGNGAVVPDNSVFENTLKILGSLPKSVLSELKRDRIYPTPYGTIVLEWQNGDEFVSVEIGENSLGYFSEFNDNKNVSLEKVAVTNNVPDDLYTALKKLYSNNVS